MTKSVTYISPSAASSGDEGNILVDAVQRHSKSSPEDAAILTASGKLNYRQLNAMADTVASTVSSFGGGRPSGPVALIFCNVADYIASMLGVAKLNASFMPLDCDVPEDRLAQVVLESDASLVLADEESTAAATRIACGRISVRQVGQHMQQLHLPSSSLPAPENSRSLIFYTSGSTGRPKGVVHGQEYLPHFSKVWIERLNLHRGERVAILYADGTSAGVNRSLSVLIAGACLCPFDVRTQGVRKLSAWLADNEVNVLAMPTSLFRTWLSSLQEDSSFPHLRLVEVATEALYGADVARISRHLAADWQIVNTYGASEVGLIATHIIDRSSHVENGVLPVGVAPPGQKIYLRALHGGEVVPGEVGEIAVQSPSLSLGYLNEPGLSAQAFISEAPIDERTYLTGDLGRFRDDGLLVHLGRADRKVKIRGYSVELYEVEHALCRLKDVTEAVVTIIDEESDNKRLVAFVEMTDSPTSPSTLRAALASELPSFMVPSEIVVLRSMPLTLRGKIDRKVLLSMVLNKPRTNYQPGAVDEIEHKLLTIWKEVLKLPGIGLDESLYDLGGSSLQAYLIIARISDTFHRDLPVALLFQAPTISLQAEFLRDKLSVVAMDCLMPVRVEGASPALFFVHGGEGDIMFAREIAQHMKAGRPVFALQPSILCGSSKFPSTVETIASCYLSEIRAEQANGPYFLAGYSFGGRVAFEMARQLCSQGEVVEFLGIIDTLPTRDKALTTIVKRYLTASNRLNIRRICTVVCEKVSDRLEYVTARVRIAWRRMAPQVSGNGVYNRSHQRLRRSLFLIYRSASEHYKPEPCAIPILAISAMGKASLHQDYWSKLTLSGLTVVEIPADHEAIVRPPHSIAIARAFDTIL